MRRSIWQLAVVGLGLIGLAVSVLASLNTVPGAAVVVPLGLIPLSALAVAFVGLARTSAVLSYAVVTVVAIVAPIADVWSRSAVAGNFDDAPWLGVISSGSITLGGVVATVLARVRLAPVNGRVAARS